MPSSILPALFGVSPPSWPSGSVLKALKNYICENFQDNILPCGQFDRVGYGRYAYKNYWRKFSRNDFLIFFARFEGGVDLASIVGHRHLTSDPTVRIHKDLAIFESAPDSKLLPPPPTYLSLNPKEFDLKKKDFSIFERFLGIEYLPTALGSAPADSDPRFVTSADPRFSTPTPNLFGSPGLHTTPRDNTCICTRRAKMAARPGRRAVIRRIGDGDGKGRGKKGLRSSNGRAVLAACFSASASAARLAVLFHKNQPFSLISP